MIRLCVIVLSLLMCSCAHHANDRLVLGSRYKTASFGGGFSVVDLDQSARPRSRWDVQILVMPTDGTITAQTLRTPKYLRPNDPPRLYGLYPTQRSALHEQSRGAVVEWWWTLNEFGRSFGEVVLMPYRALVFAITQPDTWSPERAWKRTDQTSDSSWSTATPIRPNADQHKEERDE